MGQACCAGEAQEVEGESSREESRGLSSFELETEAPAAQREALQALLEALLELRRGERAAARRRLSEATQLLDVIPEARALRRAFETEDELQKLLAEEPAQCDEGKAADSTPVTSAGKSPSGDLSFFSPVSQDAGRASDLPQEELDRVLQLCGECRLLDAGDALKDLDESLRKSEAAKVLQNRIKGDPLLDRLREAHTRLSNGIRSTVVPAMRTDVAWSRLQIKDPTIGPNFVMDIRLRHADPDEREANGPQTQLIMGGSVRGFPLHMIQVVALFCEVDLFRKEWIKDSERMDGKPACPERMMSGFLHTQMAPKMLPFKLEDVLRRDFAVRVEKTPEGMGPGVTLLEADTPHGALECQGWPIPQQKRGYIRLSDTLKLHHFMPSTLGPDFMDAESALRVGLPLPQWMVQVEIVKRLMGDIWTNTFRQLKKGPIDNWESLPHNARLAERALFYDRVMEVERAAYARAGLDATAGATGSGA